MKPKSSLTAFKLALMVFCSLAACSPGDADPKPPVSVAPAEATIEPQAKPAPSPTPQAGSTSSAGAAEPFQAGEPSTTESPAPKAPAAGERAPTVTLYQHPWHFDHGGPQPIQVVAHGGAIPEVGALTAEWSGKGAGVSHIKIWLPKGQRVAFYSKKNYQGHELIYEGRGLKEGDDISIDLENVITEIPRRRPIPGVSPTYPFKWDDEVRSVRIL